MLKFLKENGYPVNLEFDTKPYEDMEENFHGYQSDIFIDGHHFDILIHSDFWARVHYADGFFASYRWESDGKYKWRGKKEPLIENGDLNIEVEDWIMDKDGYFRKVKRDSDPDMPYKNIDRHATEKEVKNKKDIKNLLDKLKNLKESNKSSWNTYGSELCAGDMIRKENDIENQIKKLRNVSKT